MVTGMMWFDDDKKKSLNEKIAQAAEFYAKKYGRKPDTCMVNMLELGGEQSPPMLNGISVGVQNTVLPHHLWIGRDK